jgi:hypothetical protein
MGPALYFNNRARGAVYVIETPGGQNLTLVDFGELNIVQGQEDALSCKVMVPIDNRPWHQRYWAVIKFRLGL